MENQGQITKGMYKGIDLTVFTFIACAFEYLNIFVFRNFFPNELYTLSLSVPITLIVLMRWNAWALVPALLTGLARCSGSGAGTEAYACYMIGNCFALAAAFWFRIVGKKKLEKSIPLQIAYTVTGFLSVILGCTLVSLFFEGSFIGNFLTYFVSEEISGVLALFIVYVAAKQKDLFKDQNDYLKELALEREKNSKKHEEHENE